MDKSNKEFQDFAEKAHETLVYVKGVFPFDFFPDEATLDRQMFTIRRNRGFGIKTIITAHHDDILNSHCDIGPFFGTVTVHMKYVTDGREVMNWLSRDEAIMLHAVLQGLLSATKQGMDMTTLDRDELVKRLHDMGKNV